MYIRTKGSIRKRERCMSALWPFRSLPWDRLTLGWQIFSCRMRIFSQNSMTMRRLPKCGPALTPFTRRQINSPQTACEPRSPKAPQQIRCVSLSTSVRCSSKITKPESPARSASRRKSRVPLPYECRFRCATREKPMNKLKLFFVAAFVLYAQAISAQTAAPLKLATKYEMPASVKGRFDHLAIDTSGNRLFVVGEEAQQVLVFDVTSGKFIRDIKVDHPHAVLYREDLNKIYITDEGKGVVNIYDGKTYDLQKTVTLKVDADSIGYDPATHYLYVDNGGDNAHEKFTMLSVVDTTAASKIADIKIDGDTLEAMALEKSGSRLFLNNPAKTEVEVIDRKANKLTTAWPVKLGKGNATMALDESTHRLFVGCRSGVIVVFDSETGKEL